MKKLLALFVALAFLAGSASISLAQTGNGGSVVTNSDVSKSAPAKVHSKKKAKTTKKTGTKSKAKKSKKTSTAPKPVVNN